MRLIAVELRGMPTTFCGNRTSAIQQDERLSQNKMSIMDNHILVYSLCKLSSCFITTTIKQWMVVASN